jgi:hypothetical protein
MVNTTSNSSTNDITKIKSVRYLDVSTNLEFSQYLSPKLDCFRLSEVSIKLSTVNV